MQLPQWLDATGPWPPGVAADEGANCHPPRPAKGVSRDADTIRPELWDKYDVIFSF